MAAAYSGLHQASRQRDAAVSSSSAYALDCANGPLPRSGAGSGIGVLLSVPAGSNQQVTGRSLLRTHRYHQTTQTARNVLFRSYTSHFTRAHLTSKSPAPLN